MGWFDELMKERKEKNQEIFDSSLKNVSETVFGPGPQEDDPMITALRQIFKHYKIDNAEIPAKLKNVEVELDAILSRHNLMTKTIRLEENWIIENKEPVLAYISGIHTPIALFQENEFSYYFFHPTTGKKTRLTPDVLNILEVEAITFYSLLPRRKLTIKDAFRYVRENIRVVDLVLVLVLMVLVMGATMATPYLEKILMGEVIDNTDYSLFLTIALVMSGIAITAILLKATQAVVNARLAIKVENSTHSVMMMRMLSLPTSFFKKYNTGELNARLNSVSTISRLVVNGVFVGGLSSLLGLFYLIQIASFSIALLLPSLGVVVVNVAFLILAGYFQGKVTARQMKLSAKENGVSYDLIRGIQKIRLTGSEKRAFAKWAGFYTQAARLNYNPPWIVKFSPVFSTIVSVTGAILIYYLVAVNHLDQPTYVAFNTSYGFLSGSLLALAVVFGDIVKIHPLIDLIRPILEEEPESGTGKKVVENLDGSIKLDHVSFRYGESGPLVLDDLSLDIKQGEYVAIVGRTGCGKSTIVRLLLGFEKPIEGKVSYGDLDVEEADLPSLRRHIGSVTQNGALFHADIFHNITISAPELGEDAAWEAAKIANIDEDIRKMPMGMHTVISEGQGSISGGQKQRIMIARSIVHKPKILILDEATSALDNQCQKIVTESLAKLECTRVVIAHRLSTIKQCDRILFLEHGKIIEEGTYDELIELNGRFKELIDRQKLES